jgi:hypothetical protein
MIGVDMRNSIKVSFIFFLSMCGILQAQFNKNENLPINSNINQPLSTSNTDYLERIGEWPYGPSFSVAVDSLRNIIFLGSGGGVLILDGTDRTNPQLITDTIRTTGLVEDIFYDVNTERLYLACGDGGYEIWNVENPSVPFLYSRNEIYYYEVETPVGHVQVRGDFAVFECGFGYIHSVNVSDPYNPFQVSFNGLVGNPAHNIHIDQAGYVHATGYDYYIIYSLDGSGNLHSVGGRPIQNCNAVFGGTQASYVGQGVYLWIVYGVANYHKTDVGGVTDIAVRGDLAYVTNEAGLNIWNVADNNNPYLVSTTSTEEYLGDICLAGSYAYISAGSRGVIIFDISDPSSPAEVGSYKSFFDSRESIVLNDIAYIAHSGDGLLMVDISNPDYPELIGQFETGSLNYDVRIKNGLAFLACWEAGFKIVDVSNPASPVLVAAIENFNASKLEVSDNYAYVVESYPPGTSYHIKIFDVTNPENPVEQSSTYFDGRVTKLAYYNGYLFVADNDLGVRILNVSDPQNPVQVNFITIDYTEDVYIRNNLMFVCSIIGNGGLHVFDITNPEMPVAVYYYGGGFFDVAVVDSFWYVSDGDNILLFYLEDSNPVYLDRYRLPYLIFGLSASDKYIYVTDGSAGFSIYKNNLIENPLISNWEFQTSGISEDIWAVDFTSLTNGWAAADNGILLHTTDGGNNWQINQVGGSPDDFRDITFVNENTGWVCGNNSSMYKTTNGGQNWFALSVPTTSVVRAMCFLNESLGWVVTLEDHLILKTTDGGETWTEQNSGLTGNQHLINVLFTDELNGFVLGFNLPEYQHYILKTTDGGETWTPNYNFQSNTLNSVYFINHDVGWIGGSNGLLIKTTDAGETWQTQNSGTEEFITAFSFTDENKGWYTGFNGTLFQTNDGGSSWLQQEVLIQNDLRGVYFVNEANGWAVGSNGIILHYHETITGNDNEDVRVPDNFVLSQNYPNPFNPSTTIQYSIPESGNVSLKIFNTLGEEVANLVNEYQEPGIYKVNFNAENLSSGVYYYRLESGRFSQTHKMILLR